MRRLSLILMVLIVLCGSSGAELPYARNGLSPQEAAAHLLDRFSTGARPGEVELVAREGLEAWLERQLKGDLSSPELESRLATLPEAYRMSNEQILAQYPNPGMVRRMATREGVLEKEQKFNRSQRLAYLEKNGMRPYQELGATLFGQKIYHARYNENTLREVMTEFWFNHFNVALSDNRARSYLLSYERDLIRPGALGPFRELLGGTAKHPAMLHYLDNASSTAGEQAVTTSDMRMDEMELPPRQAQRLQKRFKKRKKGLNENYARELMELHTLGVDGGYTQQDVEQVARAFTGWTAVPPKQRERIKRLANRGDQIGFVQEGDFVFAAGLHDAGAKTILGRQFPAGGGVEEGERVLDLLSVHPNTARHLARKFAQRFISDEPSPEVVESLARTFQASQGDSRAMIRAIANSDEFWNSRASKVKSPFELLISSARALEAELEPTRDLYGWLVSMGQPLYNYQAPTGFPDRADFWVSSGTVLNRVNFGLQAGTGQIRGFHYTPWEKGSLESVVRRLLPGEEPGPITAKIQPLFDNPQSLKVERSGRKKGRFKLGFLKGRKMRLRPEEKPAALMIGLVLGSPEFQRR